MKKRRLQERDTIKIIHEKDGLYCQGCNIIFWRKDYSIECPTCNTDLSVINVNEIINKNIEENIMNEKSIEYGWLVLDANIDFEKYSEIPGVLINNDSVCIETHPFNPHYIFISLGTLKLDFSFEDFPDEPVDLKQKIIDWLKHSYPNIKLKWDVIHTER